MFELGKYKGHEYYVAWADCNSGQTHSITAISKLAYEAAKPRCSSEREIENIQFINGFMAAFIGQAQANKLCV